MQFVITKWDVYPFIFIAIIAIVLAVFVVHRHELTNQMDDLFWIRMFFLLILSSLPIIYFCKSKSDKIQNKQNDTPKQDEKVDIVKKEKREKSSYAGTLVFAFLYALIAGLAITQAVTVFSDPDRNYYINYAHNFDGFLQLLSSKPALLIATFFVEAVMIIHCGILFMTTDARKELLQNVDLKDVLKDTDAETLLQNERIKKLFKNKKLKTLLEEYKALGESIKSDEINELIKREKPKALRRIAISDFKLFFGSLIIFFEAVVLFYAGNTIDDILNFAFWIFILMSFDMAWCIINIRANLDTVFQWLHLDAITFLFVLAILVIFHSLSQVTIEVYGYLLVITLATTILDYKMGWKYVWSYYDVSEYT